MVPSPTNHKKLVFETLEPRTMLAVVTDGPLVGGVTPHSAKVFVRTSTAAMVATDFSVNQNFGSFSRTASQSTVAGSDFTSITALNALAPNTTYYYRSVVNGAVQPSTVSSFKTFPQNGADVPFSFVVTADLINTSSNPNVHAPAYKTIAAQNPAFVMQIGDFDHRDPKSLAGMRTMHRNVRNSATASGADLMTHIAPRFPFFHLYDDHDYGMDNGDKTWAQKGAALKSFKEYYPSPPLANPRAGIWHSFSYGQAEFFMLDLRSQRDPDTNPEGPNKSILEGDPIANGQKEWLKQGLASSTARWKFIISTVPFNPTSKPDDSWGAFKTERNELVNFIKQRQIGGVLIVSGDLHSGGAIDNGSHSTFPELSVPHTNLVTSQKASGAAPGTWSQGLISGATGGGFGKVTLKTNPDRVLLEAYAANGTLRKSYIVNASPQPTSASGIAESAGQANVNKPTGQGRTVTVDASGNSYVAGTGPSAPAALPLAPAAVDVALREGQQLSLPTAKSPAAASADFVRASALQRVQWGNAPYWRELFCADQEQADLAAVEVVLDEANSRKSLD